MIWTLPDGTVAPNSAAMKQICADRGLDWSHFRRRDQKGMARRAEGPRSMRLPDDWRVMLDSILGAGAVLEFVKEVPTRRPAIVAVTNATDTKWWHALARASAAIHFVRGRINYVDLATGLQLKGNPRGTVIHLFADRPTDVHQFADALRHTGCTLLLNRRAGA